MVDVALKTDEERAEKARGSASTASLSWDCRHCGGHKSITSTATGWAVVIPGACVNLAECFRQMSRHAETAHDLRNWRP